MISVIVPVYKVEKYLPQCLDSLISQTLGELEIVLVNDGSPDGCPALCDEYAARDSRIKVIHRQNGGLVSARKAGLAASSGEYIGFVDGDDWVEPDTFEKLGGIVDEFAPDMILNEFFCDFETRRETSEQLFEQGLYNAQRLAGEIYPNMLFSGTYYRFGVSPSCWSKLYKRRLLEENLTLVDERIRMGEDAAFTYPCLLDAQSVFCLKEPLYHYRILGSSMSRGYDSGLEEIIYLPYHRLEQKNGEGCFDISRQLAYYMLYLANFAIRNELKSESRKSTAHFIKRMLGSAQLQKCARELDASLLPAHTALLAGALRKGSSLRLRLYMLMLGIKMRAGEGYAG